MNSVIRQGEPALSGLVIYLVFGLSDYIQRDVSLHKAPVSDW